MAPDRAKARPLEGQALTRSGARATPVGGGGRGVGKFIVVASMLLREGDQRRRRIISGGAKKSARQPRGRA
jgi:hypothetical protein